MGKRIFLIDFDCTITQNDTTDELMKIYNQDMLEDYQRKFRSGEITVKKYLSDLITSLNIDEEEYKKSVAKNVIVDKYFKDFIEHGEKFRIVSAGTVLNIVSVLESNNIYVNQDNIYSNKVIFENGKIRIEYPYEYDSSFYGISKGNIVDKYKDKGFEIVGISFDNKKENWMKARTDKNMNWIHLSDIKGWKSLAAPMYGVNSIPCTLLIDKDGTILQRNIFGDELEGKLAELLK